MLGEVFGAIRPGTVVIDMSTIDASAVRTLAEQCREAGGAMLDAPVSGGEIGAIDGTLSIMLGGEAEVLEHVRPVLAAMGHPERITHIGPSGAGQVAKACNQMVLGVGAGRRGRGVRARATDRESIRPPCARHCWAGSRQSRVLDVHGERMLQKNYVPGFRTELFAKDYRIVMQALTQAGVSAPVTAVVQQLLTAAMTAGRAKDDYSSMATVTFTNSGLD